MMTFGLIFYFIGVVFACLMMYRNHKHWLAKHPESTHVSFEFGFGVIGALLSWFTVFVMFMGALASFNELEWDEGLTQEEIDAYLMDKEARKKSYDN